MPFLPIATSADDRKAIGLTPIVLRNARLEPSSDGDARAPVVLRNTPGRRLRATFVGRVRGVFQQDGVRSGALFVAAGTELHRVASDWSTTVVGLITGTDDVLFTGVGDNLVLLAGGQLSFFGQGRFILGVNGLALSGVGLEPALGMGLSAEGLKPITPNLSGSGAPSSLTSVAGRVATHAAGLDIWDWSAPLNPFFWPDGAFAQSARRPDAIVAQVELGGDIWHFGTASVQVWRVVSTADEEAFDTFGAAVAEVGLIGRRAWARIGQSIGFVGVDQEGGVRGFVTAGYAVQAVPHRPLEEALAKLTPAQLTDVRMVAWGDGSLTSAAVILPNDPRAFVFDQASNTWRDEVTWGATAFFGGFATRAFGQMIWASPSSENLCTLDASIFDDRGATVERVMTITAPLAGPTAIASLVVDIATHGLALGATAQMEITYSRDGGRTTSDLWGDARLVTLDPQGSYRRKAKVTRLGLFNGLHGLWLRLRITDAAGFAVRGVYVNEDPS